MIVTIVHYDRNVLLLFWGLEQNVKTPQKAHTAPPSAIMMHHTLEHQTRCMAFKTPAIGMNKTRTVNFIETILRDTPHTK
jgi:hypothetical protein